MGGTRYKLFASRIVTRHWSWVLLAWLVLAVALKATAPRWETIAADGDLAFLPPDVPSAIGRRVLEEAFPGAHARSSLAIIFAVASGELSTGDKLAAMEVARHLHWLAAASAWKDLGQIDQQVTAAAATASPRLLQRRTISRQRVLANLTEIIELEQAMAKTLAELGEDAPMKRIATAYRWRAELHEATGDQETAAVDRATASLIIEQGWDFQPETPSWHRAVHDVWSWRSAIVGHKMGADNPQARLINMQLDTDFAAVANLQIMSDLRRWMAGAVERYRRWTSAELEHGVSGAAAVGADMLRAAAGGIRITEIVTVVLVLLILTGVYRAPFLVAIPVTSIAVSLIVATSLIAHLARDPAVPESSGLGVFSTTRIFIVVILFGAGTDFCLFFLARNRELIQQRAVIRRRQMHRVVEKSWLSVHNALVASALTTIAGLGLMWFSRFEKFRYSGPVIAISLAVTLLVCLSFTPALLSGLGTTAFWPLLRRSKHSGAGDRACATSGEAADAAAGPPGSPAACPAGRPVPWWGRYWDWLAEGIARWPGWALALAALLLAIPAAYGIGHLGHVTYDFTKELSRNAPSRTGAALIGRFFPLRDASPVTILVTRPQPFDDDRQLLEACEQLATQLYVEGVESVRSLADPLGDFPPGKTMSLFEQDAWRRRTLRASHIAQEQFLSSVPQLARRVARFDVVLRSNVFSMESSRAIAGLRKQLEVEFQNADSPWWGSTATFSGTAVGIADLRQVTQADQRRIQMLVTGGVWLVLWAMLRHLGICTYLILSVLFSYFATLGITHAVFGQWFAGDFYGLDWKVPLFLFVILVAVGQDYNVYLVSRIFEERKRHALRDAVVLGLRRTGGIITSCGVVMAGTFAAMTSPALVQGLAGFLPHDWLDPQQPVLRGITELGFALSCGVLLDTFIVRSILVPSFLLLMQRGWGTSTRVSSRISFKAPND
ncbi:MAG: transporter [Pirellulaceae bacterium]|nr:MAG: transporter [Pirellulaceae bacterium]